MLNLSSQGNNKKAFDRLKVFMAVNIFDPKKDIPLTTDASEHSISGILSQGEHSKKYLSRRLTNTEFNYSNIEKEALTMKNVRTSRAVWEPVEPDSF